MTGSGDAERASWYAIFTRALIHSRDTDLSLLDDFDRVPRLVAQKVPVISTLQQVSFRYILHRALRRLAIIWFLLPASEYHLADSIRPLYYSSISARSSSVCIDATCSAAHHTRSLHLYRQCVSTRRRDPRTLRPSTLDRSLLVCVSVSWFSVQCVHRRVLVSVKYTRATRSSTMQETPTLALS